VNGRKTGPARDEMTTVAPRPDTYRVALFYYEIALAALMLGLGLWQWSIIVGISRGFEAMPAAGKIATMVLAVADVVAGAGLWMRVAWGRVIFVVAAVAEIALHTVFIATYGSNWTAVALHLAALAAYAALAILARRRPAETA
jgi:hypothetical protein